MANRFAELEGSNSKPNRFASLESTKHEPEVSGGRTALDQTLQGATYGFSDEIMDSIGARIASQYTGEPYEDMYKQARQMSKERMGSEEKQHPYISGASQLVGAVALPGAGEGKVLGKVLPEAIKGSKALGRIAKGTVGGATGGAAMGAGTASEGNRLEGAKEGAEIGGATGGILGTGLEGAGKLVAPHFDKAVDLLRKEGVILTPGQLATNSSKFAKWAENASTSIPLVGTVINNAKRNSIESFNTAVLNRALKPIGEKMPKGIEQGRASIAHVENAIGKKYDALVPKLSLKLDQQFYQDSKDLATTIARLPEKEQKHFESIINSSFSPRDVNGAMDGRAFKAIDSELANDARTYSKSTAPEQRQMAIAINKMRGILRENLERSNPAYAKELQDLNTAWATFSRAQEASIRRPGSGGIFSPADLAQNIKQSSTKGAFARGDGLLQDLSDAGMKVLPNDVPDSGTASRSMWNAIVGGGAGAAAYLNPVTAAKITALAAPYTKPGMAAVGKIANPGKAREAVRTGLEDMSPSLAAAVGQMQGKDKGGIETRKPLKLTITPENKQ